MLDSISKNQLIALLLIQAAEVDYNFADEEKEYIRSFVSEADFIRLSVINSNDRIRCHEFIKEKIPIFFPDTQSIKELKDILLTLCLADKSYHPFERTFMEMFREQFIDAPKTLSS